MAPHLDLLSLKLVELSYGWIKRLMVMEPPRHGKSETISHWYPVWHLDGKPEDRIILTSHGGGFAAEWGARVRNTIAENPELLHTRLAADARRADRWKTTRGGGMVTGGVDGSINGRAANILIADDLIKNWQDAASPTIREHAWNWWLSTAYTRLEPGAGIALVATRWHTDDVIGKLLARMSEKDGEQWDILNFPAIAEWEDELGRKPGDALWSYRFPVAELLRIKGVLPEEIWEPLYQQRPKLGSGVGRAYKAYTEANKREVEFNPHYPLCLCCDFNVDPMSWVILQDYGDRVYVLEEISLPDATTLEAVEYFRRRLVPYLQAHRAMQTNQPMVLKMYGDASGTGRNTAGKADWALIKDNLRSEPGIHPEYNVPPGNPYVRDRVTAVNAMLCNAKGERRMLIHPRCKGVIKDLERVVWKVGTVDLDKRSDKTLTHLSDALGYEVYREHKIDGFNRVISGA